MSLQKKIRVILWAFIVGLVLSGATAIPLLPEINWLVHVVGSDPQQASLPWLSNWLLLVQQGLQFSASSYPFLFYGTDWLAFGHFVIAIAFIGPIRDPVKNVWVVEFGLIASVLVIPFALIFGEIRGIPLEWRLVDCCFGIAGVLSLGLAHYWIRLLEKEKTTATEPAPA